MKKVILFSLVGLSLLLMLAGCGSKVEDVVDTILPFESSEVVIERDSEVKVSADTEKVDSEIYYGSSVQNGNILEIKANTSEINYSNLNGGVIVTYNEDIKFGAVDYSGKEIVPNIYDDYYRTINADGQFVFATEEEAIVFDNKGNEILRVENPSAMEVGEGVVSYINGDTGYLEIYDLATGETTEIQCNWWCTGKREGIIYFDNGTGIAAVKDDGTTTNALQMWVDPNSIEHYYYLHFPLGIMDGYGALGCYLNRAGVANADFSEVILMDMDDFYKHEKIDVDVIWNYDDYYENGCWNYNYGKKVVINITNADETKYSYLLDFSKAKLIEKEVECEGVLYTEKLVSNYDDVIIAKYNTIVLSASGNYLASDGAGWMYIDETGKILARYEDCSSFNSDGYAAVIEDGMAYVIDSEFNKISDAYVAQRVSLAGEALVIANDDEKMYLVVGE